MSVLFLCKLLSLNISVAKLKRRLFYIFVLTLTQTYEENLCFTRLNNFANDSKKKKQKLTRILSGSLFFYTFFQFLQVDYYFLRTENFTNTCQRARFCEHCHDCRSNFSIQVAGPCEGWTRNVTVLPWKIKVQTIQYRKSRIWEMLVSLWRTPIWPLETNRNICFQVFLLMREFFAWGTHKG